MKEVEKLVRVAKTAALAGGQVLKEHFRKVKREDIEEKARTSSPSWTRPQRSA